jgi:hypothetical protein
MDDIDIIREYIKHRRKYASFFEWFKKAKNVKEVGVVQCLLESLAKKSITEYRKLRACSNDPPDCLAETIDGALIGFEVKELVDQKTIELNERGKKVYRDWTISEAINRIQEIIDEKDYKKYHGGPYRKLILVIPTAEPVLTCRDLTPMLDSHCFKKTQQLHEAFLLFQYDSATQSCPYLRLKITANPWLQPTPEYGRG